MNPFLTTGYVSPGYFCDREKETLRLLNAVNGHSNLTLFSIRRMGKTGLIKHLFHKKESKNNINVYLDIAHANSLDEFVPIFSNAILKKFRTNTSKFISEAKNLFKNIRPVIKFDGRTGEPRVSFEILSAEDAEMSLEYIFDYLKKRSDKKQIIIAIDEFQQITNFREKNVEARLRSLVQDVPLVSFIFSGSKNTIMKNMFFNAKRPFYQSSEPMSLEHIGQDGYRNFIFEKFQNDSMEISADAVNALLSWTRIHTYYVQYFCYKLYSLGNRKTTIDHFHQVSDEILEENESVYDGYKNFLSPAEFRLLLGIAKEGSVESPTSFEFMNKYQTGGSSTVTYALKRLTERDFIYRSESKYYVYDVFFSRWLERL